jgi:hypothetical protein
MTDARVVPIRPELVARGAQDVPRKRMDDPPELENGRPEPEDRRA